MQRGVRELRIIGGSLRGRKLSFPDSPGLRPTPDRVRETLFNWLAPHIAGTRVLDLFAGSGALGFESLSRGAASAVLVEKDRAAAANLQATATRLGLANARIANTDALSFIRKQEPASFDLVMLDPPFAAALAGPVLEQLARDGVMAAGGFCYVELPAAQPVPLPDGWTLHRTGKAGEVGYHLLHAPSRNLPRDV